MLKILLLVASLTLIFDAEGAPKRDHNNAANRLVCYLGRWSNDRKQQPFKLENIDESLCTHLVYGYAMIDYIDYTIEPSYEYLDLPENDPSGKGHFDGYRKFNDLRKRNEHLTTLIAIGGWNEGSVKYSNMAQDPELRKAFIKSVHDFLKKHDFDGIYFDWEFPANRGGDRENDKENLSKLIRELKDALSPDGYVFAGSVSGSKETIDTGYDIKVLNELDFYVVMAYDYHGGSWETYLGHNSPLYTRPDDLGINLVANIDYTIRYLLDHGAERKKMVLGLPTFGRTYELQRSDLNFFGDPAKGPAKSGIISNEDGVYGYNEICNFIKTQKSKWTVKCDKYYQAMYMYSNDVFVSYENPITLGLKISYLKEMHLSGGMIWSLETDDFLGECGDGKYPMLTKAHDMLIGKDKDKNERLPDWCDYLSHFTTVAPTTKATTTPRPTSKPTKPSGEGTFTIDDHGHWFKCPHSGYFAHPYDVKKYIMCEYMAGEWRIFIHDCSADHKGKFHWDQKILNCIEDDPSLILN